MDKLITSLYQQLLSKKTQHRFELVIIGIAIGSFLLHLLIISLVNAGILSHEGKSELLGSLIAAIYTPFSFILLYEVYLLVYYLPKSVITYIGKQYEIITLIVIRRIFKDISKVEVKGWEDLGSDLQLGYDLAATLLLFFLIFLFYKMNQPQIKKKQEQSSGRSEKAFRFVQIRKLISIALVPILIGLALYSLGSWIYEHLYSVTELVEDVSDINNIFFDDFFTILILTDVLILLISFFYTDHFSTVIRNSGFVISTILIKMSFSASGLLNPILIVSAVLFGVIILWIHNLYRQVELPRV